MNNFDVILVIFGGVLTVGGIWFIALQVARIVDILTREHQ